MRVGTASVPMDTGGIATRMIGVRAVDGAGVRRGVRDITRGMRPAATTQR
jgi:hypothetical protein